MRHLGVALKWLPISSKSQGEQGVRVWGGRHEVRQAYLLTPARRQTKFFNFCRIISGTKSLHRSCLGYPLVPVSPNCPLRQRLWRCGKMKLWMCVGTTAPQTPTPNAARCSPGTACFRSLSAFFLPACLLVPPMVRVCAHFSVKVS